LDKFVLELVYKHYTDNNVAIHPCNFDLNEHLSNHFISYSGAEIMYKRVSSIQHRLNKYRYKCIVNFKMDRGFTFILATSNLERIVHGDFHSFPALIDLDIKVFAYLKDIL